MRGNNEVVGQRPIKFRAWDEKGKRMCEWNTIKQCPLEDVLENKKYKFNLMQYTGLKDKNGKEIYEGDILKNKLDQTINCHVIFDCGKFCVEDTINGISEDLIELNDVSEIIGNIYENKELLNG